MKSTALIRSPYPALCSEIQERIKGGEYNKLISLNNSVPDSYETVLLSRRSKKVEKLKSFFGKSICFYSFENACTHPHGPVGFLLKEFLGQDPSAFDYKKTNESLSNLSARIQNELNAISPSFVGSKLNAQFQKLPLEVDKRLEFSGKFLLTEVEYELVEEFVQSETKKLNELTGLGFSGQSLNFSKPIF